MLTCHQTSAPIPSAAASQRFPGLGQKCAEESARIATKAMIASPIARLGLFRFCFSAAAAIESGSPSSGMTSQAAT